MNFRNIVAALAIASSGAFAALPSTMLFQGSITVDGAAQTGSTTLVVALYDASTAGTKVWEESFANVTLVNGAFAVQLGGTKALPAFDKPLYVQLAAGGKAAATRAPLTLAPYAAMAGAIPNVRSSADTTYVDASTVNLGAEGMIVAHDGSATAYRSSFVDAKTSATGATLHLGAKKRTSTSSADGGVLLTDSLTTVYASRGSIGGGTGTSIDLDPMSIKVRADSLVLTETASVLAAPTFRLVPGSYVNGPDSNIPTCDATTQGTIIYNPGYAGSSTSFQGCVYLGAGSAGYAWKVLNN